MVRRLTALLLILLIAFPALAEQPTTLRYAPELKGVPADLEWMVYTGPGEEYLVAGDGRAKVSSNGQIWCYGRVADTGWLMIRYFISSGKSRIGYIHIHPTVYRDVLAGVEPLCFRAEYLRLQGRVEITDDPQMSKRVIGTVSGDVTLLALKDSGREWAYIEARLDKNGMPVRGFIPLTALNGAVADVALPASADAGERFVPDKAYALKLPDDALAEGMTVYPLNDGTFLIAYRCGYDGKLYLRVIGDTGKKLWAKSVPRHYLSQIILTPTGFCCLTWDRAEAGSCTMYEYTGKGKKWTSGIVSGQGNLHVVNGGDYTIRYKTETGKDVLSLELTSLATLASAEHRMSVDGGLSLFLHEAGGMLCLYSRDEAGTICLRLYDESAQEVACIPAPEGMSYRVNAADHARNAVYFFTGYSGNWQAWRFDRELLTFASEPVDIRIPDGCTLIPLAANAAGTHDALLQTEFGAYFCQLQADGRILMHQSLPGRMIWASVEEGSVMLLLQDSGGKFHLRRYHISEG